MSDLLETISIILACWAAIAGIDAWKHEFIGKRKIEIAEKVLEKFFEVNDAISFIRNPFAYSGEGRSREKPDHERPEESELLDRAYIVFERYESKKESFQEFSTLKYRFMASFGREAGEIMNRTNQTTKMIFVSARALGDHYWPRQGRVQMDDAGFKAHLEQMHKHEERFWDGMDKEDIVRKELEQIREDLEAITSLCFEETSTLYGVLTNQISASSACRWVRRKLTSNSS